MFEIKAFNSDGKILGRYRSSKLPIVIGRSHEDVDFQLPDPSLSSRHCVIEEKEGKVLVRDFFSKNGIIHQGEKTEEFELEDKCEFYAGRVVLVVSVDRSSEGGTEIVDMKAFLKEQQLSRNPLNHPAMIQIVMFLTFALSSYAQQFFNPSLYEWRDVFQRAAFLFLTVNTAAIATTLVNKIIKHQHYFRKSIFNYWALFLGIHVLGLLEDHVFGYISSGKFESALGSVGQFLLWVSLIYVIVKDFTESPRRLPVLGIAVAVFFGFYGLITLVGSDDKYMVETEEARAILYPIFSVSESIEANEFAGKIDDLISKADKDLEERLKPYEEKE